MCLTIAFNYRSLYNTIKDAILRSDQNTTWVIWPYFNGAWLRLQIWTILRPKPSRWRDSFDCSWNISWSQVQKTDLASTETTANMLLINYYFCTTNTTKICYISFYTAILLLHNALYSITCYATVKLLWSFAILKLSKSKYTTHQLLCIYKQLETLLAI